MTPQETPLDACPHCGAPRIERDDILVYWCGTVDKGTRFSRSLMCKDPILLPKLLREIDEATDRVEELEAEVKRLRGAVLSETQARVKLDFANEKLLEELARTDALLRQSDRMFQIAELRADKAEANLRRAIEIADIFAACVALYQGQIRKTPEYVDLIQLKATLQPDNK